MQSTGSPWKINWEWILEGQAFAVKNLNDATSSIDAFFFFMDSGSSDIGFEVSK